MGPVVSFLHTFYLQHTCQFSQVIGNEPSSFLYKSIQFSYKYKNGLFSSINFDFDVHVKKIRFFQVHVMVPFTQLINTNTKRKKADFINSVFHAHIYFSSEKNYMYIGHEILQKNTFTRHKQNLLSHPMICRFEVQCTGTPLSPV